MAKRAGLPVAQFVAATNVNDVVPEYLATGRFAPRASVRTMANAMDVGHPSNFELTNALTPADTSSSYDRGAIERFTADGTQL